MAGFGRNSYQIGSTTERPGRRFRNRQPVPGTMTPVPTKARRTASSSAAASLYVAANRLSTEVESGVTTSYTYDITGQLTAFARTSGTDSLSSDEFKALKSANTIDASMQCDRQKQLTAEEPITSRIRRRAESMPSHDSAREFNGQSQSESSQELPIKPAMTFQERIVLDREQKSDGQSPS